MGINVKDCVARIGHCRNALMGIAMLSVVVYHLYCWAGRHLVLNAFRFGYIGVDVFIFLSGFGLCYSYRKNSLKEFYLRRVSRIFPLYIVWRVLLVAVYCAFGGQVDASYLKGFFLNVTTLSYWLHRGDCSSWFVPAILFLYLTFPIFFWLLSKTKMICLFALTFLGLFSAYYLTPHIGWYYACLVDRVPAFALGIIQYLIMQDKVRMSRMHIVMWGFITVLALSFPVSAFYRTTLVCPFFIAVTVNLCYYSGICGVLTFIGKHSYELFFGHIFGYNVSCRLGLGAGCPLGGDVFWYCVFSFFGFVVFYYVSQLLTRRIGVTK